MKYLAPFFVVSFLFLVACDSGPSRIDKIKNQTVSAEPTSLAEAEKNWKSSKGIGPIKSLELPDEIDEQLAANGNEVFEAKCTACHKIEKRFIGPSPKGVLDRRTPEWVMNMILNPEEMVQQDFIAKFLLMEYNGSPMANQNLTEDEARSVLEYFRTL